MKDLDDSAHYARYIKVGPGLPCRPVVCAAKPGEFSRLLSMLNLGPEERLIRGRDSLRPDIVLFESCLVIGLS
jgi:hypothetical protein